MIQIYGPAGSSAGRCYWTLEELGLSYEAVPVDFRKGEHKQPQYLNLNPNGKVPLLKEGDFVLWESMAIDFYLAEKHQPYLLGKNLEDKAHVLKWSFWALAEYQKPLIDAFIQKVFVPEDKRDHELIKKSMEKAKSFHQVLEQHLQGRQYIVGDNFSLADLHVASVAKISFAVGDDLTAYPALKTWLLRMLERPAAVKVAQLEKN